MSHQEYVKDLDIDQLERLIELLQHKINATTAQKKVACFVVSDEWINYGFYRITEHRAALKEFTKEFESQINAGTFESLEIRVKKFYPEEIEDVL